LGAEIAGRQVGRDADVDVFSIGATKQIAAGEGGVVTTQAPEIAARLRRFALQGHLPSSLDAVAPGMNLKVQEITAALALRLLERYPEQLAKRRRVHERYAAAWTRLPLRLQEARVGDLSALKDQLLFVDDPRDRDRLLEHLDARGIGARPYYSIAIPDLAAFRGRVASAERSRDLASRSLAVPIHARMESEDVEAVSEAVVDFFAHR
jgi:perosamine synthetase